MVKAVSAERKRIESTVMIMPTFFGGHVERLHGPMMQ